MYQPMTDDNTIYFNQLARRGSLMLAQLHLGCHGLVCRTDQTDQVEKQSVLTIQE